mmetsp:Transcript_8029/g.17932  ORF Transcript_8029/g.17932 Transcript_8029/m.17932 type:complete len:293 (-) Transcript_8029:1154-2032(-)
MRRCAHSAGEVLDPVAGELAHVILIVLIPQIFELQNVLELRRRCLRDCNLNHAGLCSEGAKVDVQRNRRSACCQLSLQSLKQVHCSVVSGGQILDDEEVHDDGTLQNTNNTNAMSLSVVLVLIITSRLSIRAHHIIWVDAERRVVAEQRSRDCGLENLDKGSRQVGNLLTIDVPRDLAEGPLDCHSSTHRSCGHCTSTCILDCLADSTDAKCLIASAHEVVHLHRSVTVPCSLSTASILVLIHHLHHRGIAAASPRRWRMLNEEGCFLLLWRELVELRQKSWCLLHTKDLPK